MYGPAGLNETATPVQFPRAVAVPIVALEVHNPASADIVVFEGQVITGKLLSVTIIV